MKKIFFIIPLFLQFASVQAQKYGTALGVRIARTDLGISLQQRFSDNATFEVLLCTDLKDHNATVLIEHHFPIVFKSINYYLGLGGHVGYLQDHGNYQGVDVLLGFEYKFPLIPLLISYDLKPEFHFNHEEWFQWNSAFSVRYVLVTQKEQKRNQKKKEKKRKK